MRWITIIKFAMHRRSKVEFPVNTLHFSLNVENFHKFEEIGEQNIQT